MSDNYHFPMVIPENRGEQFRDWASQVGLSKTELLRRMVDYCLQERVMNEIIPSMSGRVVLGSK